MAAVCHLDFKKKYLIACPSVIEFQICICDFVYQISSKSDDFFRWDMTILRFVIWRPSLILHFLKLEFFFNRWYCTKFQTQLIVTPGGWQNNVCAWKRSCQEDTWCDRIASVFHANMTKLLKTYIIVFICILKGSPECPDPRFIMRRCTKAV